MYICWKFQLILTFGMGVSDIWSTQVPHEKNGIIRSYGNWKTVKNNQNSFGENNITYNIQHSIENAKHIFLKSLIGVQIMLQILWMTDKSFGEKQYGSQS